MITAPPILIFSLLVFFINAHPHDDPACELVVVGAGIGGIYTAWRLSVDTKTLPASSICILEAKNRPGGRILSVDDPVPGFENYTVDLGAYRYHRNLHRHTRLLTESALGIQTQCYLDPLERGTDCSTVPFNIASTRGRVFGVFPNGTNAGSQLSAYGDHIPYMIPPQFQWGPGKPLSTPRSPGDFLAGTDSVVKEIGERWDELNNASDYETAMRIADEIIFAMKNGSYRGTPYTEVSLLQAAVKEGMTDEEFAFFFEGRAGVGGNANFRQNLDQRGQLLVRETALLKSDDGGVSAMVNPVMIRDGISRRIGMKTVLDRMLEKLSAAGARIHYNTKVIGIRRAAPASKVLKVEFENRAPVTTGKIIVNMGKPDLISMGLGSEPIKSSEEPFRRSVERTFMEGLSKVYCFWEDAWWLTKLKLASGRSRTQETMYSMRYHDGHYTCENTTALTGCRGGALVSYVFGDPTGLSAAIWTHTHNPTPYSPLTNTDAARRLIPGNMTGTEQLFFDDLHAQIRRVHKSSLEAFGHDVNEAIPNAVGCIYGDWHDVGTHDHMGPGKGDLNMFKLFTKPVPDLNVSLVSEAWGQVTGWAESSLHSAERALFHVYGIPKPSWMDETFHSSIIVDFNQGSLGQ